MAESRAFCSNVDSAARWEHSRIPVFVMIGLLFATTISRRLISGISPFIGTCNHICHLMFNVIENYNDLHMALLSYN